MVFVFDFIMLFLDLVFMLFFRFFFIIGEDKDIIEFCFFVDKFLGFLGCCFFFMLVRYVLGWSIGDMGIVLLFFLYMVFLDICWLLCFWSFRCFFVFVIFNVLVIFKGFMSFFILFVVFRIFRWVILLFCRCDFILFILFLKCL